MWTSRTLKALPKLVITLAAVVAIGFGASEALAEDAVTACPYYPPTEIGECYNDDHCNSMCSQQPEWVPGSFAVCQSGCCACFL